MPTVVQFGAGAIGRGFLGQLWSEGGYEVVFVDVDRNLVDWLNREGRYPLRLEATDGKETEIAVAPVRALHVGETDAVASEVASCAFVATAVGAAHAPEVGRALIAPGLALRYGAGGANTPLNVLCCENGLDVPPALAAALGGDSDRFGVVQTVVGRMVPPPQGPEGGENPLLVVAEPYKRLPFYAGDWRGELPEVPGLVPVTSALGWELEEARKIFTHNGGHALLAYHGYLAGHEFVYQAAEDAAIVAELHGFWGEVDAYLARSPMAPLFDAAEQADFEEDLLRRFRNRVLRDTVIRVGRDPVRKLGGNDRLVGAALRCLAAGVEPTHGARAIAAALRFDPEGDSSAAEVQAVVRGGAGVAAALERFAGLPAEHPLSQAVTRAFPRARDRNSH
jgi:Mannitol-1-phosphate/altronate dehydrogenases